MKKIIRATTLTTVFFSSAVFADLNFNGFASITAGQTMGSDERLYGYDDDINFKNESLFALQVMGDMSDGLSATAQIVAKGENDFDAEFEWAYITYQINDSTRASVGKLRIPFYRYSDYLDVGYAYRWIRPPQSVYNLNFSTYEGASLLYDSSIGNWDSSLQGFYGNFEGELNVVSNNDASKLEGLAGINWTLSYDWFSARMAYIVADVNIDLSASASIVGLIDGLNMFGQTSAANGLMIEKDDGSFIGLGLSADYNDILVDMEYTEVDVKNSLIAKQTQYYLSFGYRLDDITLHATVEHKEDEHPAGRFNTVATTFTHPQFGELPLSTDPTNPAAPLLNDIVNQVLLSQATDHDTVTIGMRYNFHPSAAFKVDYSRRDNKLSNTDASVFAVGVDLVF